MLSAIPMLSTLRRLPDRNFFLRVDEGEKETDGLNHTAAAGLGSGRTGQASETENKRKVYDRQRNASGRTEPAEHALKQSRVMKTGGIGIRTDKLTDGT